MSRLRASSAAFPPGLDLRNQYRMQTQNNSSHGGMPIAPRSGSFSGPFSGGYASAPLTAPVDFSLPRTPVDGTHGNRDFSIPQLSAPMAPPQDFSNAYNSNPSPVTGPRGERDFGNQPKNNGDSVGHSQSQVGEQQRPRNTEDNSSYLRPISYETMQKQKQSFAIPGTFESP